MRSLADVAPIVLLGLWLRMDARRVALQSVHGGRHRCALVEFELGESVTRAIGWGDSLVEATREAIVNVTQQGDAIIEPV